MNPDTAFSVQRSVARNARRKGNQGKPLEGCQLVDHVTGGRLFDPRLRRQLTEKLNRSLKESGIMVWGSAGEIRLTDTWHRLPPDNNECTRCGATLENRQLKNNCSKRDESL